MNDGYVTPKLQSNRTLILLEVLDSLGGVSGEGKINSYALPACTCLSEDARMWFQQSENFKNFRGKVDAMGPLERRIMEVLWARGELSVRDIYCAFEETLAYTTVMTTLDRLHQKGLLRRRLEGRAYFYAPTVSGTEFEQAVARGVLEQLLTRAARQAEPLLSCIVEAVTEHDQELLDELERLIQAKKRELQQPSSERSADAI